MLTHVVTRPDGSGADGAPAGRRVLAAAEGAAQGVLRGAWDMALEIGVDPDAVGSVIAETAGVA